MRKSRNKEFHENLWGKVKEKERGRVCEKVGERRKKGEGECARK